MVSTTADIARDEAPPRKHRQCGSSWWSRTHSRVNHAMDNFFYRLGYSVARHPKRTLLVCLVLVVGCCFGFANFKVETAGEELWVPADSLSKKHEAILESYFGSGSQYALLLVESPSEGENVLTKDSLDELWELDTLILALQTDAGSTYADLCETELDGITCSPPFRSVLRFWADKTTYEASVTSDADVLVAVNADSYPNGDPVSLESLFGNTITYDSSGDVSGARAMMHSYFLEDEDETFEWFTEFQDLAETEAEKISIFNMVFSTSRSMDDALEETVSGEIFLFAITYIIMATFVQITLGRCCTGFVRQRAWLAFAGVLLVVAAGLAAYGLNSAFGIPFTSLSQILPFILIGIGVDDMFVIVSSFDHTDSDLPVEERVALSLKRCGVSVTYTSLTSFFAFMLGATTSLPAVEYFCLYAATAILFDFFLQMTAFVALLTMDANRQKAGRLDWCCCFKSQKFLEGERVKRGVVLAPDGEGTAGDRLAASKKAVDVQLSATGKFMKDKYAPALLSVPGKVIVLLASAALFAVGIYGVTQATQGFDVANLAADDHYVQDYIELTKTYELSIDEEYVPLAIYTREVDYTDVEVQAQMHATDALMVQQEFVVGPIESWLSSFVAWTANGTEYSANVDTSGKYPVYNDRGTFYTALMEFTEDGDNARFLSDISFNDDGEIEMSLSEVYLVGLTDSEKNVNAMEDARDVVDQSTLDPKPFAFSPLFIFVEQFVVIYGELISNFILALVAVAILSTLVLGKAAIVMLVCFTIAMIDVELLGFVYHWGLEVNSITVIELIMAVGLVVDYMVHIVHYFLHQNPNTPKDARIADALGEIGPSVLIGATTTFFGIMPLAFASSFIFRVFFKMFLIIISFGAYHGLVFVPVALSLLPDCAVSRSEDRTAKETTAKSGQPSSAVCA